MERMHKYLDLYEQLLQATYINVALVRPGGSYSLIYFVLQDDQLGDKHVYSVGYSVIVRVPN